MGISTRLYFAHNIHKMNASIHIQDNLPGLVAWGHFQLMLKSIRYALDKLPGLNKQGIFSEWLFELYFDDCLKLILTKSLKPDPHADALAKAIGGESRSFIEINDTIAQTVKELDPEFSATLYREFDVVSDKYIGQAKNTTPSSNPGKSWRVQVKATFLIAKATGRIPYFQFNKGISEVERSEILRYAKKYIIDPIIDTKTIDF